MTETLQKKCSRDNCSRTGELQPRENFCRDVTQRDGLHRWCKDCVNVYKKAKRAEKAANTPKPTPVGIKLAKKAIDIVEALPEHSYSMSQAYKAVTGFKNGKSLSYATSKFWENVAEDEVALDMFRSYLINDLADINLRGAFTGYFHEAMSKGSLGEKNQALNLTFKVLGWMEKQKIDMGKPKLKTSEDRLREREEFLRAQDTQKQ